AAARTGWSGCLRSETPGHRFYELLDMTELRRTAEVHLSSSLIGGAAGRPRPGHSRDGQYVIAEGLHPRHIQATPRPQPRSASQHIVRGAAGGETR
ncbi:hypothetical protein CRUP_025325, partial [Coryphaenoides rupestris]